MPSGIGLCGAHRVGKTTLAHALSETSGLPFLKTHTSHVFQQRGLDPAKPMPFEIRLSIQHEILAAGVAVWSQAAGPFLSDRTPIDMAAYTLADVQSTTKVEGSALADYLHQCLIETNRFFSTLIIVPPGIPLIHEPGKAALHEAYIEHLHAVIVGICHQEGLTASVTQLARQLIALDARLTACRPYLSRQHAESPSRQ